MPKRDPQRDRWRPAPATAVRPAPDRVEEARAGGTPPGLRADLEALLGPGKVLGGAPDLVRYATDASPYRFVPQTVVVPDSVQDVVKLLGYARAQRRNLVFRAAGTSLNGQAQGEDILVDVRRHFAGVEVEAGGTRARVLPGTVLARANAALARHRRVLGPDPASAAAATVGGVLATNAAGAAAGSARDSYRTVVSLTAVLASGTVVDTADPDADAALAAAEPELYQGLLDLKDEIEGDPALTARIRAKHAVRNTGGYRLDAFLDAETPVQILRGLMIGSQGTLGFVAEAVYATLPARPAATAGLLFFPTLDAAAGAAAPFAQAGAAAVELMDGQVLAAAAGLPGAPGDWHRLPADCAALLVEFRAADDTELAAYERAARRVRDDLGLVAPVASADNSFSRDPAAVSRLWRLHRAAAAAVGGARPPGTTLVTVDFAVPPHRLAEACAELRALQRRHGFEGAVAGHAAHGTLRFPLALDAAEPADVERYAAFTDDFCRTVTERFDGSLAAGHGTGRTLAPFLEREWGPRATALMWRVKALLDPVGVLAPRVVLDQDPRGHLRGLKTLPVTGEAADACTECGLCEPVCPSREATTTPRQRIALRREMFRQPPGSPVLRALLDAYGHDAVDSCAGDTLCATACPAGIDTGALMRDLRRVRHTRAEQRAATALATHWQTAARAVRAGMSAAGAVRGSGRVQARPGLAPRLPRTERQGAAAVYLPSCANRIFGPPSGGPSGGPGGWVVHALVALAERAGQPLWIPPGVTRTCCGAGWHAGGYDEGHAVMANRVVEHAWAWTGGGRLPLVVDAQSCALGLTRDLAPHLTAANRALHVELTIMDAVAWTAAQLLPKLTVSRPLDSAVLHPTCAAAHLGADPTGADLLGASALETVARACAREVVVPDDAGCCGAAPDHRLRRRPHGPLTAAATRPEAEEVAARPFTAHLSADRSCELALEDATGEPYASVLTALERATRP
ncbi:FAD-binding and (Fe-S)-binding domain-containing protein [Actinacidiphila sp. bgisy145]|uniref:FAD-binding and (Fe-S)-binding domain-containing protein n=1 Tax=Actinacidiphila sp. bgisy145 TaxID=3413792 RepID=UPI003EBA2AC4